MPLVLKKYRQIITYALTLAVLLVVLQWLEFRFLIITHAFEIYASAIALIFTSLGIWLARKLTVPRTTIIEREVFKDRAEFIFNEKAFEESSLSKRELEVLELMAKGLSNQEIADHLFVSLNTIKTHNARLFEKLSVKRRTQAIELGKKLNLIP